MRMLPRRSKKMWEERARLAAEMRSSGMQQKEWCEERGINPGTFRWWIECLKELEKTQGIKETTPAGWVEVFGGKEIGVKNEPSATVIDIRIVPYIASVRPGFDKAFLAESVRGIVGDMLTFAGHKVYLACGSTDMRKGINGLILLAEMSFKLDPFDESLCVFCNRSRDRLKILEWDGDGFWDTLLSYVLNP